MLRDDIAQDQIATLLLEPQKFPLDIRIVVDRTDDDIILHDLCELFGTLGDVGVADDRDLSGISLRIAQRAEHVVDRRGDLYDGCVDRTREHARCAAS